VTRLLLDQGLPRSAASLLRQTGWIVVHVSEIGMSRAGTQTFCSGHAPKHARASRSMPIFIPCLRRAASDPLVDEPSLLPSADMIGMINPAGEGIVVESASSTFEPGE